MIVFFFLPTMRHPTLVCAIGAKKYDSDLADLARSNFIWEFPQVVLIEFTRSQLFIEYIRGTFLRAFSGADDGTSLKAREIDHPRGNAADDSHNRLIFPAAFTADGNYYSRIMAAAAVLAPPRPARRLKRS